MLYSRNKTLYTQVSKKLLESITDINKDTFLQEKLKKKVGLGFSYSLNRC